MAQPNDNACGNLLGLHNVLITRFGALGNVVMTIPVVYSACRCYPDVNFVMATQPSLVPLFVNAPDNLKTIGIDVNGEYSGFSGARRLVCEMRANHHIDAFVDLQNDHSTHLIALFFWLNKVKTVRFNRAMHRKRELTRRSNKVMLPLVSSRARYRETFFKAGLTIEENFDTLYSPALHADAVLYQSITTEVKPQGIKWIGIAPFAAHPEKEYPPEKMEEVLRLLSAHDDVRIFLFGAPGRESDTARRWQEAFPRVTSLAGNRYGFPAEFALVSNLDAMLTMDSANMHIAAVVGTPTISIWGATHHYCGFRGWHQSENDMVQVPLSCRPCSIKGDKVCYRHDRLCLSAIRPEMIYAKVLEKVFRHNV